MLIMNFISIVLLISAMLILGISLRKLTRSYKDISKSTMNVSGATQMDNTMNGLPEKTKNFLTEIKREGQNNLSFEESFKENEISKGAIEIAHCPYFMNETLFLGYVMCKNLDEENLLYCKITNKKCGDMISKNKRKIIIDESEIICPDYKREYLSDKDKGEKFKKVDDIMKAK